MPQEAFIFNRSNLTYATAIMTLIHFYRLFMIGASEDHMTDIGCRMLLKKSALCPILIDLQISADVPYDEA